MSQNPKNESMPSYQLSVEDVLTGNNTDIERGLTHSVAQERLSRFGPNALPEQKRRSTLVLFLKQFQSPLIYLLFAAAVIAIFLNELSDAAVILVVVIINSIVGAVQEGKAEKSLESLRKLSKLMVKVRRDGHEMQIEARALVPGDILLLGAGDAIGADGRVAEARDFFVAEAALTGESLPVEKMSDSLPEGTILADRRNMVYSGTFVTAGRAAVVVVATGEKSEVGKIARLTSAEKEIKTPLEAKVAQFGRLIIVLAAVVFVLIVVVGTLQGLNLSQIFMVGVSQIVSMIPEGLPVAITVALAVGVSRMAERKAIVRKLSAVETLGSTNIICTDKTGTLTKNEMTVREILLPTGMIIDVTGVGYLPEGEFVPKDGMKLEGDDLNHLRNILSAGVLCNDSSLGIGKKGEWEVLGDPTEGALLTVAGKKQLWKEETNQRYPRKNEIPFDSSLKFMATENFIDGKNVVFIKGAPEKIFSICSENPDYKNVAEEMAGRALRVLAFARFEGKITRAMKEGKFDYPAEFLGLMGQMDPPRDEVYSAVKECWEAGIRPIMVTGDHKQTGLAIGRMLGIVRPQDEAVDGKELDEIAETELEERIERISVFARVHPEQKLRIIEALQRRHNVVAMTGDGVNDAPALARADVGVAMGITGTDTAKEAAKIIITDDNFATIVQAVKQGRLVYRNVKKLILYLFTTALSEILVLFTAILLGYPPPLAAVQILWINLVTDGALTVTLIMEPEEGDEMRQKPISRNEPLVTGAMARRMAFLSPSIALSTLGYFIYGMSQGRPFMEVQTGTFTVLAVSQWFNALNSRSDWQSAFSMNIFRNKWLIWGLIAGNLLQASVIFLPFMNEVFHTTPIPLKEALVIGLVASLVLWVEEIRKFFRRRSLSRN